MATTIDLGAVVPIHKGDWNTETLYERANIVRHNSTAWLCKVEQSIGVEPSEDSSDWSLMVKDMSAVTSVNGKRGDVTLDFEHVNTPSLEDSSNRVANTEFINQKLEPVNQQLNSLSEQLNTLDTDSVKGSNVSVLPKANSIPKTDASGKLDKGWLPTNLENADIEINNLKDNKANVNGDNAPQLVNTYSDQTIAGIKTFKGSIKSNVPNTSWNNILTTTFMGSDNSVPPVSQEVANYKLNVSEIGGTNCWIDATRVANGDVATIIGAQKTINGELHNSTLQALVLNNGVTVASCSTPPSISNSSSIATTQWVRARLAENGSQIVQSKHIGTSWYRKYSDGFIMQGGDFTPNFDAPPSVGFNINFLTPFSTTNYYVNFIPYIAAGGEGFGSYIHYMLTQKTAYCRCYDSHFAGYKYNPILWVAIGY